MYASSPSRPEPATEGLIVFAVSRPWLYHTIPYHTILYYTILSYTISYYTVSHYNIV